MSIIEEVRKSWGWTGIVPVEVVNENDFGGLLIKDADDRYWRICPEDVYCEIIAEGRQQLDALFADEEFLEDWHMRALVEQAKAKLGPLAEDRKYCLKIPGLLGGEYGGDNLGTAPLIELIRFSGDLGYQAKDLPEGTQVKLDIVD